MMAEDGAGRCHKPGRHHPRMRVIQYCRALAAMLMPTNESSGILGRPHARAMTAEDWTKRCLTSSNRFNYQTATSLKQRLRVNSIGAGANSHALAFSRRIAPEVCRSPFALPGKRARGTPGARCTRGLVCVKQNAHEFETTVTP
ncbi:hypothetical protein NML43_08435, partial [Rhodopseudomonas palustris]|uniref:hypothetical protein n=1 Tax=Rhodopseudomonas palustris TaxID=1076 RepID=UPI0020CF93AE